MGDYSVDVTDLAKLTGSPNTTSKEIDASSTALLDQSNSISYTPPSIPDEDTSTGAKVRKGMENIESGITGFGRGVAKGISAAPQLLGGGLQYLGSHFAPGSDEDELKSGNSFGDRLFRLGAELTEKNKKYLAEKFPGAPGLLEKLGEGVGGVLPLAASLAIGSLTGADEVLMSIAGASAVASMTQVSSYNALREKGMASLPADLQALVPAGVAGALTATGLGIFFKAAGGPLTQIAKGMINGAMTMGLQTAATGEVEHVMGINPGELKDRMANYATSAIVGAIMGGSTGVLNATRQHAQLEADFRSLGLDGRSAIEATKKMMDSMMSRGLYIAKDIVGDTAEREGRLFSTDRQGMPLESFYPSVQPEKEPLSAEETSQRAKGNTFVRLDPVDLKIYPDERLTGKGIVEKYTGPLNQQLLRGSYLVRDGKITVPDELEQRALFYEPNFDKGYIQKAISDPEGVIRGERDALFKKLTKDMSDTQKAAFSKKFEEGASEKIERGIKNLRDLKPVLEKALYLSNGAQTGKAMLAQYFKESLQVCTDLGTIHEGIDNFVSNRLYKVEPPNSVKTQSTSGFPQSSYHNLERLYDNPFMALADGKEFATDNAFDLAGVHNKEMAYVNHSRQMADVMHENKIASWIPESDLFRRSDWERVGELQKTMYIRKNGEIQVDDDGYPIMRKLVLAAPKGIVDAIRPIVDPDQLRQFDAIRGLQNAQGVIKTGMLSFALFHDKAMAIQTLASEKGWATMANLFSDLENNVMDQPGFRGNEMYFTGRGLETAPVHDVEDIMRGLELNKGILGEALNAPVAKQLVDLSKLHTTFLFDKFQRYIKVMTCTRNMAAWDARFPEATTEQRDAAASGFAKATNATFGGLNWANLGITRTQLSVMRMTLLAPDWVVSAIKMANYGLTDWGKTPMKALVGQAMDATAGQQARGTMFKAIVGGYLFGNAMSYLLHNTFMSDNKKGHHNEVEVAPDVYFSPFAGGPGEIVKLLSDIKESGGGKGSARYVQGKFAPAFSAGVTALSGVNYYGGNIWKGKSELARDVHATWDVASHLLPLPISLTGGINYAQREQDQSALGWAAMGLGLGRFSKPSGKGKSSGGLNLQATYERQRQNVFKTEANQ